jgi:hypothetical protein
LTKDKNSECESKECIKKNDKNTCSNNKNKKRNVDYEKDTPDTSKEDVKISYAEDE